VASTRRSACRLLAGPLTVASVLGSPTVCRPDARAQRPGRPQPLPQATSQALPSSTLKRCTPEGSVTCSSIVSSALTRSVLGSLAVSVLSPTRTRTFCSAPRGSTTSTVPLMAPPALRAASRQMSRWMPPRFAPAQVPLLERRLIRLAPNERRTASLSKVPL
jgi:hypothetical protein